MAQYLDKAGLEALWAKIGEKFIDTTEFTDGISGFAKSDQIGLKYDHNTKTISLTTDGSATNSFDASDFLKDGMLKDVAIKTVVEEVTDDVLEVAQSVVSGVITDIAIGEKVIEFTWNTDAEDVIKVDYLRVTDISVDPETSNTKLSESITVAGGPLADLWLSAGLGDTIDPSKYADVQSLLKALFCVEKWSKSITESNGSPSASVATTLKLSKSNNAVVEFGTEITVSSLSATQTNTSTSATISGFEYGYSTDGSTITTGSSVSKAWSYAGEGTESAAITGYVGFGLSAVPAADAKLIAGIGTNSITATSTGVAKTATCEQVGPVYDVSNLKAISETANTIESQSKDITAPTSTATQTVYGVYPVYTNYVSGGNTAVAGTKVVGTSKDQTVFEVTYADDSVNKSMFMWPGDRTLSVQLWNPTFSTWGDVAAANQATADTETVLNNVTYKSWTYTGNSLGNGAKFKFTLGKKISE